MSSTVNSLQGMPQGQKRALLARLLAEQAARPQQYPLSSGQERLWFLSQLEPESAAYNIGTALEITGALDGRALAASLAEVTRRQKSLRTTFASVEGQPMQVVAPGAAVVLPEIDLRSLPAAARPAEEQRVASEVFARPFDLAKGPLLRVRLLRQGDQKTLLVVVIHHIISDGWSLGVLIQEVVSLYAAFAAGRPSPLPRLPIQYGDYARWQRQWLQDPALEAQLDYWRDQLKGAPPLLELPTDRPRPPVQRPVGSSFRLALPPGLTAALAAVAQGHGATLFMGLLAVFQALLGRWSGQEDIVVGSPVAGRSRRELEGLIGFFVNMLVLRTSMAGSPGLRELLARVRETALGAYAHQDLPFEHLVSALQPERSADRSPLFQVALGLQSLARDLEFPGFSVRPYEIARRTAIFDLTLLLTERPEGVEGVLEYNRDLFDAPTARRLVAQLETLLASCLADLDHPLSELPLLGAVEAHQVVTEWNDTFLPQTAVSLPELFERQVRLTPGAVALVCSGEEISYAELNRRANRLAHHLRGLGIGPGERVGVLLDRSAAMVVAVLGIAKAGAAYVPLEIRFPEARMQGILTVMESRAVVVGSRRLPRIAALAPSLARLTHVICLDAPGCFPDLPKGVQVWSPADLVAQPEGDLPPLASPEALAYVIFTSGSTGTPKGVAVRHRPAVNLIEWVNRRFAVGPVDRLLFVTSLGFDLSVYDLFGTLTVGASLRVATQEELEDPWALARILATEPITFWDSAPAALAQLAPLLPEAVAGGNGSRLRRVFLSGDWVPLSLPAQVRASFPGAQVIALGGATEATVWSNFFPVAEIAPGWRSVPYGRPITNARYYVLDRALLPCPPGVPGDLYIGGGCLALGYAGEPALTACQFQPDPWAFEPGGVMYRTGDRARFFPDGTLEFLGRLDHQVKIRGFRIELGEIEAVLSRHPEVSEALALMREDRPGERLLVAYVVPVAGCHPTVEELRAALSRELPEYMVPAAWVLLESLPVTANGKVDRGALPAPSASARSREAVLPRNPVESALARIWSEVLGRESVSVEENFFELGGDSILSIQVVSRAGEAGLRLTPRHIFEHPTVAGLARVAQVSSPPPADADTVTGPVPLTPVQHWFFEQGLIRPEHFNQALFLEMAQRAGRKPEFRFLVGAIEHLLRRHDVLHMRFEPPSPERPYWLQILEMTVAGACWTEIDLTDLPQGRRRSAIESGAACLQASLSLAAGRLLRVALFTRGTEESDRLLLVLHHLVVDGVSWRILLEDLEVAYRQLAAGKAVELPSKTTSFQHWAERLSEHASSDGVMEHAAYWLESRRRPEPVVPLDRSVGADIAALARSVTVRLDTRETRLLLQEVPQAYHTQINDVLLTALVEAFAAWTGSRRLLLDLELHGREDLFTDLDLSRTVGWFTSICPVQLDLEGIAGLGECLKSIKEQLRAIPEGGIGYGLQRYLAGDGVGKALSSLPRPRVLFNYLGQMDQAVGEGRLFRPAEESAGPSRDPRQIRSHLLEINGGVSQARLWLRWTYGENRHLPSTIELLSKSFLTALRSLIAHCVSGARGYTPSDFPLAGLDQASLDQLVRAAGGAVEDLYPATPIQQGMLFHTLHSPESGVYVEQLCLTLGADVDIMAFEHAWQQLIQRHPVLRTAFLWRDVEIPLQRVVSNVELQWNHEDWRSCPGAEQREHLKAYLAADRARGFDLSNPLMRLTLIRQEERRWWFLWTHHHALLDGWSVPILLRELFAIYESHLRGSEAHLGPVPRFRDYVAWLLRQDEIEAERFWRRALSGFTTPTPLGVDHIPAAPGAEGPYEVRQARLDTALMESFSSFARRQRLTPNTLVQGVWSLLLHRYSGERDVLFGVVTAGRSAPVPGIETMVGLFINTLPARVEVPAGSEVVSWLEKVQSQQALARQYEYSSLSKVRSWSEVPGSEPLFESILAFENYPVDEVAREQASRGLSILDAVVLEQTHYPLTFVASTSSSGLQLRFLYDTERFDGVSVSRMLGHAEALLVSMLANGEQDLDALPLLAAAEQEQVVREWNDSGAPFSDLNGVHDFFGIQAARQPDALAVEMDGEALSYRELDERANRLAWHLQCLGVGSESTVGICLERSLALPVAVLAVLKAGAAYVPLDPSYPTERLRVMAEDARLATLLTASPLLARLPSVLRRDDVPLVLLDAETAVISARSAAAPAAAASGGNLAYVLYTSGSTGKPKGVAMPHCTLINLVAWQLGMSAPAQRTLQFASLSFDVSCQEMLATWGGGGCLVLVADELRREPRALLRLLCERRVERLFLPFVALQQIAEAVEDTLGADLPPLREVITAGEQLQATSSVVNLFQRLPGARLDNQYGPTETHVVTAFPLAGLPTSWLALPPIGRPVANLRILLLDPLSSVPGQAVPLGVPGELYIGGTAGVGLARGYLGRPDLTAERFLPDPWSLEPGARLYKSGDLARFCATGEIQYLGRADQQVKVRGFRVEPGEIESVLSGHPTIRAAAVLARPGQGGAGTQLLVAYLVAPEADLAELRAYLAGQLPEHMVPSAFVFLEALPLTPSGKVHRQSLAKIEPERALKGPHRQAGALLTTTEDLLAGIWTEVLGVQEIGSEDDFFDLGGHSLLATQVISRVRRVFGVELPVRRLFAAPTLGKLAQAVREVSASGGAVTSPPIRPQGSRLFPPLSFAQERLWFLAQLQPGLTAYNLATTIQLTGDLNVLAVKAALDEIVMRHEVLRTTFAMASEGPVQVIAQSGSVLLPVVDLKGLSEVEHKREILRLGREEEGRVFDLATGPLLRVILIVPGEAQHVVLAAMHHIVSDGWSLGLFIREFTSLYEAFRQHRLSPLSELTIQYADYAQWQREWLSGEVLDAELAYWRGQLAGAPLALDLPTDRPRPAVQTFRGANRSLILSKALSKDLKVLSRHHGSTLFMTLLAAFQVLLSRYTGCSEICVGTPIAGRNRLEIEPLIGLFINTLVLKTDIRKELEAGQLLGRVREMVLGAYAHQDLPFEKLVRELQPERDLSRSPLFQVMFDLQNMPSERLELMDIRLEYPGVNRGTAQFDLSLIVGESVKGLEAVANFNRDLFDGATIHRLLRHFETLVGALSGAFSRPVLDFSLLGVAECHQLLAEWNDTESSVPLKGCLHHWVEAQVVRTPDAVAVAFEDSRLSYSELNGRADRVSERLRWLGIGPDVPVGICAERSLDLVIGLLGILKADGAYVPLDPSYPRERLAQLIEDTAGPAGTLWVLTGSGLADRFHGPGRQEDSRFATVRVVDLPQACEAITGERQLRQPRESWGLDHLAYVLYTSGSTGRPKGVQISHRALINFLFAMEQQVDFRLADVLVSVTTLSFDIAGLEIFLPLLCGARLVLASREAVGDATLLANLLENSGATILQATPATWRMLVDAGWQGGSRMRALCGGEALSSDLAIALGERTSELWNLYGPTETTIWSAVHKVPPGGEPVAVGRPIANTYVRLLDHERRVVPLGAVGELTIGGWGLARGYLGRPDLTAERFVPDMFADTPGDRLYRTGDLARQRPDGILEVLGRIDQQVKIRGFRIELGDIESVLSRHSQVREAVVLAREDRPGERRLVAYLVLSPGREPESEELRAFLKEHLPEYMIPSAWVVLPCLPLTPNGKLDRKALPMPERALAPNSTFVAPRTPIDEVLSGIWGEILHLDQVGIEENFFELGGHSLLATQLVSRVRESFGVELSLRTVFETPRFARLADRIEEEMRAGRRLRQPPVERISRDVAHHLSFAQERLWFLDQLQPGLTAYNIASIIRLTGNLDVLALRAALDEILQRHEILRTTFAVSAENPIQLIAASGSIPLLIIDLRDLPAAKKEGEIPRLGRGERERPFDLLKGPLLRVILALVSKTEHVVFTTMHHIVSDGWSLGIFVREFQALYEAFRQNQPSPLPKLAIQYLDYAQWQREWLTGEVLESELAWWREQLVGAPPVLELPTDRPRPAVQTFRGASRSLVLPKPTYKDIRAISRRYGSTLFMTFLATFQVLLSRYAGCSDISVGTPIAGRNRLETEVLIGFFVNTLVLRTNLREDLGIGQLLGRVREAALGAYAHQDLPFEKLVSELQPERDISRTPLFQVMFVVQDLSAERVEFADIRPEYLESDVGTAQFELTLMVQESIAGPAVVANFNRDLFDGVTIERLLGQFETLMGMLSGAASGPVLELPLLPAAERHQVLWEWNDTESTVSLAGCLHSLVEAQVVRTPDAVAVALACSSLSYSELNARADRLSSRLHQLGVGPDVPVGICAERSLDLVTGLLGILKAGGAFVPLDLSYPSQRLAQMVEDAAGSAGTLLVLTGPGLAERFCDPGGQGDTRFSSVRVVDLVQACEAIVRARPENPWESPGSENLAYVIFTSGSTGRPKGAANTHRAIVNRLLWMQDAYKLTARDRVLQKTPMSFDVSVWEFFWPLMSGASLILAEPEGHKDSAYLVNLIAEQDISILHFVPSMLQIFLEEPGLARCGSLRQVIASGEALPAELARRFFERLPGAALDNLYGPTEAAVDVTFHRCQSGARRAIPIGRPITNLEIHLLDREMRTVALGVPGELSIGGVGLARGYLLRPDLTAEKFVPHPASVQPGARLYRTGDLARQLPSGEIEYLGRLDFQVKIRGFRIELGEIESTLSQHSGVREAVVLAREDRPGDRRLVAYSVPTQGGGPAVEELRVFLEGRLPDYMIPSAFLTLATLPLTPNGKVDRRALPAPERSIETLSREPRMPTEELLAGIWEEVLGVQWVGAEDNFFERGGHSLLATQVISRVRGILSIEIPLRCLFETPTLAGFAHSVEGALRAEVGSVLPPIVPALRGAPLPLSFAQQRLWFLDRMVPGNAFYNVYSPVGLSGAMDVEVLRRSIHEIVRRHEVLRTSFTLLEERPVQVIDPEVRLTIPLIDLHALSDELRRREVSRLSQEEGRRPFDLSRSPMLRLQVVQTAAESHTLLINLHHIASDGWSVRVLVDELTSLYEAFSVGRPSPLPELPIQYADFAVWQRQWMQGEVFEKQVGYWKRRLAGLSDAPLELPTDHPRPAIESFRGSTEQLRLKTPLVRELGATARRHGATLFMVLVSGYKTLLARYSGQKDVAIGTGIANRTQQKTEKLIGFFVNTLVLRTDLSGLPSFQQLLLRVRQTTLESYDHQDLPFEMLVEEMRPERSLNRNPLVPVMLAFQSFPRSAKTLRGLTAAYPAWQQFGETGTAKFDLSLFVLELEEDLLLQIEYSTDLFERVTIRRMLGHLERLLEAAVKSPDLPVLPLLSLAEQHQILCEWSDTESECPRVPLVHELFAEHARRRPWATAVASPERRLTYGEVEGRANRLAHLLVALGVGPEVLVALCTERTLDRVVGIVAVLKAGGAYISLDPTYPRERLAFLLEDAHSPVLLTERRFRDQLPSGAAAVICLDDNWELPGAPDSSPVGAVGPDNLAYVVYTSGSTGKPKGVEIPHAGLMNLVRWHQRLYQVTSEDRGTQIASPAFDASIWELWPYLAAGASVHIPDEETRLSPARMIRWWAEEGITLAYLMTPLAEGVLEEEIPPGLELKVRDLIIGGDRLHRGPDPAVGFRLMNHYGPAEYTVTSTVVRVPPKGEGNGIPSIGRAVDNTRIYVLDPEQQPVPVGVPGELYVKGVGLARGYLRRPDLTAAKFVPDPWSGEPGARMYRTADLVRWLPDGDLDFLGRLDQQVKIRGFRIELGEIESVLGQHPGVREVVVLAREDRPGDRRLVAYLVLDHGAEPSTEGLRTVLKSGLPEYMIPSAFLTLPALPLTPNGKVDRRALPAPEISLEGSAAPRTAVEELLTWIFADVLEVERVGVSDSFFDLGGHSLLAMRLMTRLREAFSVELPLRAIFEAPSVSRLSELIEAARRRGPAPGVPSIRPVSRNGGLPLSFAQQRQWFLAQLDPDSPVFNISNPVRLSGRLRLGVLQAALDEVVRRHEDLRTTFPDVDGQPVQVIAPRGGIRIPMIDLSGLPGEIRKREQIALTDAELCQPFDLKRGPLLRFSLLRLSEDELIGLLTMHHIISDGWGLGLMVTEITTLYRTFLLGRPSPLPELPIQYADYALWERQWLQGDALKAHLAYWRRQLAGAPPALNLPTDHPRRGSRTFQGARESFVVPVEVARKLRAFSRQEGVTLFMTLLAAFAVLLGRHSGQEDIIIGAPVVGRNRPEVEGLIGYFLNALALRTNLSGNPSFRQVVRCVRETVLDAYTYQNLPFEKLVEELRPTRLPNGSPYFQVVLNFNNQPLPEIDLPDLRLEPLGAEVETSKYDLTLYMMEEMDRLAGAMSYDTNLFEPTTISRLLRHFTTLLKNLIEQPDLCLRDVEVLTEPEKRDQTMREQDQRAQGLKRLKSVRRKAVALEGDGFVRTVALPEGGKLPLVVEPVAEDLDLVAWLTGNRELIENKLLDNGGILFRNFRLPSIDDFNRVASVICSELVNYFEGSSPRIGLGDKVYTSTEYPAELFVSLHNELSYSHKFPRKILFYCAIPPAEGGETPIADSREVLARIDPAVRERFMSRQLSYLRNLHGSRGAGLSWQAVFETSDPAAVERYCQEGKIDYRWKADGGLWTSQVRPAVVRHPQSGEPVWFNQAHQFHPSNLGKEAAEALLASTAEEDLPINSCYGDGSPLELDALLHVQDVYRRTMVTFPWQAGDLLLLDNILVAHGRMPFNGPRKIVVSMGETVWLKDLPAGGMA